MIWQARLASTTRPWRHDSSAASMPASSSEVSVGASSSDGLDHVAAGRELAKLGRHILFVPGHESCADGHRATLAATLRRRPSVPSIASAGEGNTRVGVLLQPIGHLTDRGSKPRPRARDSYLPGMLAIRGLKPRSSIASSNSGGAPSSAAIAITVVPWWLRMFGFAPRSSMRPAVTNCS